MAEAWTEIGDGVHVRRHRSLDLNIGAVLCPGGILLIDTRASHRQAQELERSLDVFRLPVRWVINTHHHWDHTFGNAVFGGSAIWGHARCADALREYGEKMRDAVVARAPDHAAELGEVTIVPPKFTFTDESKVSFGDREVILRHLGRGHTDNDVAVFVSDAGVVFAGDLIEEGAPPSFNDAFPLEWPDTTAALAAVSGGVVVPGHGSVVDAAFINTQQQELAEVADLARERHAEGMTPEAAAKAGGPYPSETLETAFVRAWNELREAP
jgi:glyoxylase-like metal-dependent hydrolase (beta-lactamase superfamily II)